MGELTVIIPFCNEGNEVGLTIQSCLDLAEGPVEFVLINDNSTDGYDYHSVAKKYKATYIEHTKQWGVAPSREDGVAVCKTPYFLLLDAHMCMLNKGWNVRCLELAKKYRHAIICSQTQCLNADRTLMPATASCGAKLSPAWKAEWAYNIADSNVDIVAIECVLGAAYLTSKAWWKYIHGLEGIWGFGVDEEFMSTKTWMAGGKCLFVKDWITGHIYAKVREHPYTSTKQVSIQDEWRNRYISLKVLYPEEKIAEYQANILKGLEKGVQVELYKKLCETIDNSSTWQSWIAAERKYIDSIRVKNIVKV